MALEGNFFFLFSLFSILITSKGKLQNTKTLLKVGQRSPKSCLNFGQVSPGCLYKKEVCSGMSTKVI